MLERDLESLTDERLRLVRPPREQHRLRVESLRDELGQVERFRCLERQLDELRGSRSLPGEEVQSSELRCERGQVGVRLLAGEHLEGPLHPRDRLGEPAVLPDRLRVACGDPRRRVGVALGLEQRESLVEAALRLGSKAVDEGNRAGPLEKLGLEQRDLGKLGCLVEVPSRLVVRGQRRCPLRRRPQALARLHPELGGVVRVRRRPVGLEVVRGDHLGDLLLVRADAGFELGRDAQMAFLPFLARQRVVGDLLEQGMQESVLAALGRARVDFDDENFLRDE